MDSPTAPDPEPPREDPPRPAGPVEGAAGRAVRGAAGGPVSAAGGAAEGARGGAGEGAPAERATPAEGAPAEGAGGAARRGGPPWGEGRGGVPWGEGRGGPPWGRGRRGSAIRLAVFVAVIQLIGSSGAAHFHNDGSTRPLPHVGYLLLLAGPAALVPRRRWRVPTLAVVLAVTLAYYLLDYPFGPAFLAALVAILGTVRAGHRLAAGVLSAAAYVIYVCFGHLVATIGGVPVRTPTLSMALGLAAWIAVVLVVAEAVRVRSIRFAEIARARAEQLRARAEQQRRQASEERLRIARELHDVLGHHLSLINVQAGVGLHLMDERPEQARASLQAIKQASAEALREVRSVLGVLRPEDEAAPRAPAPSLANLSTLVEGSDTEVVITGTARTLPAELDRAAFRIAQEALTNVRRHAGPRARATVTIGYGEGELTVRVDDNGTGGQPAEDGNGIAGMRARATALGGTLSAGPGAAGGFRVEAHLPWGSE